MKRILVSAFLISALSVWGAARPQTSVEVRRPSTSVEVIQAQTAGALVRPSTSVSVRRPATGVEVNRPATLTPVTHPATQTQVLHAQTTVTVTHPTTQVEVVHPQTTVEVLHPQTDVFLQAEAEKNQSGKPAQSSAQQGKTTSAQAATSMSNYTPKQAKDFAAAQKAAPLGGGDNKLGNETNVAEKDAANKASLLGKQNNQNIDINPNLKTTDTAALNAAVEKKVEEKAKSKK